jgi:hypothetical protein
MKEIEDPVVGNFLLVRNKPNIFGVITETFHDEQLGLRIKMEWLTPLGEHHLLQTEDCAYPAFRKTNFYIYLDLKDTPQNRLFFHLKYTND